MADLILVVAEQRDGKLNRVSFETIAAAQAIAKETGWVVEVVLPGSGILELTGELARKTSGTVYALEGSALAAYTSDAYVHALKAFIGEKQPKLVLFPHTYQVKFAADVSFGGDAPWMATVQIGAFRGDQAEGGSGVVENVTAAVADGPGRVTPHEIFQEAKQTVDLSQAEVIVAVGRGIKEQKNMVLAENLAAALGGEVAASRPICDNGWLPLERQIGSSGQTVAPKLYIALGVSGAIQHIVGMKGSRTIVAINKDPEAPIFEIADVAVVGDLFQVVPALTEEIKKAKGS
jgi:electron transfer flavoprotein alpha subunit